MIVTCRQMQDIEARAFERGVSAADLMEKAGCGIAREVWRLFPQPGTLILYLGSGNNGGDALVAGRELQKLGWQIQVRLSGPLEKLKPLPRGHFDALTDFAVSASPIDVADLPRPVVQLDGLLGIGAVGEMRPDIRALAAEMNALRLEQHAHTVAMDIPSGLNGDTGEPSVDCVIADLTVTVAHGKSGLIADAAVSHVGRLALVPLAELTVEDDGGPQLLTPELLSGFLPRRRFDFHKGQAGRVGIIAGSRGFIGAAVLACGGALRAGAGLVTLLVKEEVYELLAAKVPPEIMVKVVKDYRDVLDMRFDALAIGPGLGFESEDEILNVIQYASMPAVVDADAITMVARTPVSVFLTSTPPRLLTPHPGEMARLVGDGSSHPRLTQAESWAQAFPGNTLLLKGARTVIATESSPTFFNTTGHPGMATGGMGDVLTGVCAALAGQGIPLHQAAGIGAWACGRAAEIAALSQAQLSVLPTDVIAHLGAAFGELE
ncbi:NAD(P)H-hydrate dehydratase [Brevifollis gellanilyticus]|uniref:Bifunctional NAD(P)H-hydrate repair enzyme n=1 Tax=Brevifollis gellanilyticus TaxID=748831 RepID=A0A512M325_9BACT|nr:NAD(P)H-hydrate dehydratase [Brevifollis gellanilyticus]GEP41146.1 bifunctional NAD(P)H-hydrate repair enzyme Nnr [Brevifollis gellanilyticus]